MTRREEEKAKLAAETCGAFVEIDEHKLDKGQMFLYGAKQTLDALCVEMDGMANLAATDATCPSPFVAQTLRQVVERLRERRDNLAVELTRSAIKSGAGKMHNAAGRAIQ